jgi:hypothetical protein
MQAHSTPITAKQMVKLPITRHARQCSTQKNLHVSHSSTPDTPAIAMASIPLQLDCRVFFVYAKCNAKLVEMS